MSTSRAKGTRFETEVVAHLRACGFPHAERRATAGTHDLGDITGTPGIVWECKARRDLDVAGAMDEARTEALNANARFATEHLPVAVLKRRGQPVTRAYAVLELADLVLLCRFAGYGLPVERDAS